ncbi:GDSL esterase/lipase At5g45960 [Linum perenne]
MNKSHSSRLLYYIYFVLFINAADAHFRPVNNNSVTAVLVFGDSTVDAGNNNFVPTTFKGNFPPYGQDFAGGEPTGRFSNGRLTTDFIASYVGVKENVPPYLDPSLTIDDLKTGVSFASAGTGFDPLTPTISNVIPIDEQVVYLKEYKKKLEAVMGKQRTEEHVRKSLVVVSAATNDFVISYFTLPVRRKQFTISEYERFIIQKTMEFVQNNLGLDEVDVGCCGTGLLETGFLCNPGSLVCPDASKYIFWDSIHPTEKTYYRVFKVARPLIDMLIKD